MARRPKQPDAAPTALEVVLAMCREQGVAPDDTLDPSDIKRFMVLTHAEKNMLKLIGSGYPVPNASLILRALEMRVDRSVPKAASSNAEKPITVTINTLGAGTATATLPLEMQDLAEDKEPN